MRFSLRFITAAMMFVFIMMLLLWTSSQMADGRPQASGNNGNVSWDDSAETTTMQENTTAYPILEASTTEIDTLETWDNLRPRSRKSRRKNEGLNNKETEYTLVDISTLVGYIPVSEDGNDILNKRQHIIGMMRHAWNNYKLYAWGKNELKPISKRPHLSSIFGGGDMGATIVDGLDTLYIMGLMDEFREGRDWVAENLNINEIDSELSVFETTIRFVGGLLSCYALTGDSVFKTKAAHVADALLPAFETPTGLPYALINPSTKVSRQYHWAGPNSILSEVGTLHLEFTYLSDVTGKEVYRQKVDRIRDVLHKIEKPNDLYPNFINPRTGAWGQKHISLGALGDSFYEYLLKAWLLSGKRDNEARIMFDIAMEAALDKMLKVSPGGLSYLAELKYGRVFEDKMDHLSCFSGGMFALASTTLENTQSERYMDVAKKLTHTCHESYDRSETKLGPEAFRFTGAVEARAQKSNEKVYILRPETFESYFIMWRLTKDQKYRDWGWEAVQALEKHCRVEGGYSGLVNVYHQRPQGDDVQQSFFLAETLKYLYLLFSEDELLPLEQWVFNTEAHPLPIKSHNPLYRLHQPSPMDNQV
ncbi:mannosyl-oligosaccharide alpha-1,2-mannosidase IA isoform X2 [Plodia interpunctella]|uniref:mannosyl-oligosaccharide alpha-1,2-mannosidase IA isoform X2 n=1 Tax=Plodia interpunctella TaxID=58824 RepID=UPI002368003D|nr:mannosyl-oligosaccharide alpha-1,2-mannosidase IA isoform X2 [Plodia interpunctella]